MYFKLYEDLENELITTSSSSSVCLTLSSDWMDTFRANIKKLSQDKLNNLYLLIRYSYIKEENSRTKFPYNAKQLKNGVKFDMDNFSDKLKKMVVLFVNKTLKII